MTLDEYINAERGRGTALATALGVPAESISNWKSGARRVPAERCPEIERATGGAVRCEELRPDVAWDVLREQSAPAEPEGKLAKFAAEGV